MLSPAGRAVGLAERAHSRAAVTEGKTMKAERMWTVQYTEQGQTTYEYVPGQSREQVRRVFHRQYPKAQIRSVVEAD